MRNYSLITVLILLAGAALGCSGEDNSRLNFYLVQQPPAGAAPQCSGSASTTTRLATNTYTLRLTFMRRDLAKSDIAPKKMRKKYSIVCDRVIKPGEALDFQVPTDKVDRLAMRLEAFQKSGTSGSLSLAYSGQMERVDLSGAELNMLLRTVDQRSCADTMRSPRAFHTATLLPNGQVLLLGGMVAEASGSGDKLHTDDTEEAYAKAGAELYDPDSMSFTALDPGKEILTKIEFQSLDNDQGGAYLRLSKRKALSLTMLVCAVKVTVNKIKNTISEAAIALGPVAPIPFRDRHTEDALRGAPIRIATITEAAEGASALCSPRDSLLRGSCDYRQEMVKVFVKRGLVRALEQAGCTLD